MKIAVVYESMFGNTREIAEAIADGLRDAADVRLGSVDDITPGETMSATLVVAGGPTHAHGMARRNARRLIVQSDPKHRYPAVLPGTESLREWLDRLPENHALGAAFDTRFDKPRWLTGSAAKTIRRKLMRAGRSVIASESFFVDGTGGPLEDGERERAVAWGRSLAAALRPAAAA